MAPLVKETAPSSDATSAGSRAASSGAASGGKATGGANWRPDIQGMRALAVGLVVLAHVHLAGFEGGFVGVDVFFVISGFLITQLLLREVDKTGTVSISQFYVRRARRILPAATFVTVCILIYAALALPTARLGQNTQDSVWSAFFLSNWGFAASDTDYFSTNAPSFFQHFWSLAVEEQFYLLWPLLVLALVPRIRKRTFALVAGGLLVVSLGWSIFYTAHDAAPAYFNTPARAYELMVGAILACVIAGPLRSRWRHLAGFAGIALIMYAALTFNEATPFPGSLALIPVVGTALLLAAGPDTFTGRVLSWRPLRYIGDISFSLYLWHWPVALGVQQVMPHTAPFLQQAGLTIGISVALAALTFHFVERPFQRKQVPVFSVDKRTLWLWPISVVAILAVAFAASTWGVHRQAVEQQQAAEYFDEHGYQDLKPTEDPDAVQEDLSKAVDVAEDGAPIPPDYNGESLREDKWTDLVSSDCYAGDGEQDADVCFFGDTDADATIALVGDSHAAMWAPALDLVGKQHGFRLAVFVKLACGAYDVVQDGENHSAEDCDAFRDFTHDEVTELDPDAVILGARGMLNMTDRDGETVDEQWRAGVSDTVDFYQGVSSRVVALGDVPARPDATPQDCVEEPGATQEGCVVTGESIEKHSNDITHHEVATAGAIYLDTEPFVCVEDECPLFAGDVPLYVDDSHLNRLWVEHVAPALGKALDAELPGG
ncbi:acyltransferase family protein [Microbacterium sp. JB110]|uniref:acyltransferase family protein n=1 Tax=Microbacterium sp. JB110 TaxID=2024477 RepID=UPI00097E7A90|nr:acyltransferase family protein [Microbacterium sp. JB110]RCS58819.1 acyltransferase [Microbacterium sp. JB110]SJM54771.1 O-antigen acetylase [Frigoribacterium sp. JB110]